MATKVAVPFARRIESAAESFLDEGVRLRPKAPRDSSSQVVAARTRQWLAEFLCSHPAQKSRHSISKKPRRWAAFIAW